MSLYSGDVMHLVLEATLHLWCCARMQQAQVVNLLLLVLVSWE